MKRRFFLFAAPAIVAAPSLMRVSTAAQMSPYRYSAQEGRILLGGSKEFWSWWEEVAEVKEAAMRSITGISDLMYGDGGAITRRMGLGSLLSDEEYARLTADAEEYA